MAATAFSSFTGYNVQSVATVRNLKCYLLPDSLKTGKFAVRFLKQVQPKEFGASKQVTKDNGRHYSSWNGNISMTRLPIVAVSTQDEAVRTSLDLPVASKVKFVLQKECQFGQKFSVVGEDALLGAWDPAAALDLEWSEEHTWTGELDLPIGKTYEFKFLLIGEDGEVHWQPGPNRTFETVADETLLVVSENWQLEEDEKVDDQQGDVIEEQSISDENGASDSSVEIKACQEPSETELGRKTPLFETGKEQSISDENGASDSYVEIKACQEPSETELGGKTLHFETGNGSMESMVAVAQEEAKSNN